jgi:hypothetical protein
MQTETPNPRPSVEELTEMLSAPFDPREVKFKPAVVSGQRALALAYVDARVIQDRLDDVLGVTGWQDEYECLPDGSVVCRLRLRLGDEWITKMDVGGQSEQPDEGDRRKAAFSDALKRAAVKFGIGRYLYRLPHLWCDYDPQKRQFTRPPTLPPHALPRPKKAAPAPVYGLKESVPAEAARPAPAAKPAPAEAARETGNGKATAARGAPSLPANGAELQRRLNDYEARLSKQGVCKPGDLVKHIVQAGVRAGFGEDLAAWTGPAIQLAVEETRAFEARARQQAAERKDVA